ncbi:MAG: hypothetical protein ACI9J4_001486 [Paraglaciecola sp.]|jgi:hypothetical protein
MTRPLFILCLIILMGSAGMAVLLNIQTASPLKVKTQNIENSNQASAHIEWRSILSQLPQYSPKKIERAATKVTKISPQISDSIIVGIVADEPRSVLLFVPLQAGGPEKTMPPSQKTNEIIQLTAKQGWLKDWEIEQILPDSIIWLNSKTKGSYKQPLFVTPGKLTSQQKSY